MHKPFDTWIEANLSPEGCPREYLLALVDALNVFEGKWKLQVIGALMTGKRRFTEIERSIPQINPRMLSKELKDLETNGVLRRITQDNQPSMVEYELTASGKRLREVFDTMIRWGLEHRKEAMAKTRPATT
jgi:DNA-binding HxlR family transcriptional regulator